MASPGNQHWVSCIGTLSFPVATVFTARCYASAVLAKALCLSVCLSVRHKSVFY